MVRLSLNPLRLEPTCAIRGGAGSETVGAAKSYPLADPSVIGDPSMRMTILTLLAIILAGLSACDTTRSAHGGATDNGAGGRIKIGFPL